MFTATLDGFDGLTEKLGALGNALNPVEILDESSALLVNRIRTRFLSELDPDGNQWVPSQRALSTGGKTLFLTGTLFHSLQAYSVGPTERAIGTDVPYARKLQDGLDGLVPRVFLGFSEEDKGLVEARIIQRIEEAME